MSPVRSLEEDILHILWLRLEPLTVIDLYDDLLASGIKVPILYLAKVLQNMEKAGMIDTKGASSGNPAYRPRISYFSFYRMPDVYLFSKLLWPTARLFSGKAYRQSIFKRFLVILVLVVVMLSPEPVAAQQTIFNVPSADAVPDGEVFLQHESQFRVWKPGRFLSNTEYAAIGVGHNLELDATVFNVNAPPSDNIVLGIGFKKVFPLLEQEHPEREYKITLGEMLPISLQGEGVGNWTYAHVSGRLPKLKTRLTAGASVGAKQIFGRNAVAFIGGYEQPVTKRLSLQGDWYSGTHNLGLFIPGFSYALPKETTLYFGYQIPNSKRSGSQGFVIEVGKYF